MAWYSRILHAVITAESRSNMKADSTQQDQTQTQQSGKPATANVTTTNLQHPKLPADASLIERIALPAVFAIVQASIRNPSHAAELKEYMEALRDALNAAYPED